MNISRIQQSMLKQAAAPADNTPNIPGMYSPGAGFLPDANRGKQNIIFTDEKQMQGSPIIVRQPTGAPKDYFVDKTYEGFKAKKNDPKSIGHLAWGVDYKTNGENPTAKFDFPGIGKEITVYPNRLPNYKAGLRLLAPSYMQWLGGHTSDNIANDVSREKLPLKVQPFTSEQLYAIETGDPGYLDKQLRHFYNVPENAWENANLRLSSPLEIARWRKYAPEMEFNEAPSYWSGRGIIDMSPSIMRDRFGNTWNAKENSGRWYGTARATSKDVPYNALTWPGYVSDVFNHEFRHLNTMGRVSTEVVPGSEVHRSGSIPFDRSRPASRTNMPALMRQRKLFPLLQSPKQFDWSKNRAIEPYAVDEQEIIQALLGLNAGRYTLKQDMENDKDNPNYTQLDADAVQKFKEIPDFIGYGEEGKKQLDDMMQFFAENPQFAVLMPGQSRAIGYYQNMKAAVDNAALREQNATTPEERAEAKEEREYWQKMMDNMIYSKSFLADNQKKPNISYADAYQQMYA